MGRLRLLCVHPSSLMPFILALLLVCAVANAADRINGEDVDSRAGSTQISGKSVPGAVPIPASAVDGAAVRTTLLQVIAKYEAIAAAWGSQRSLDAFADARNTLAGLADEDLASLAPALPYFSDCIQSADRLLEAMQSSNAASYAEPATDGLPDAHYYESYPCLLPVDPGTMAFALQEMQVIRTAHMIAGWFCNQDIFGSNGSAACAATETAYQALLWVVEDLEFCADWSTAAEVSANYARLEHIHGDLEYVVDTLTDIHVDIEILGDTLEDVHVDIDTLQATLDGFIDAFNEFAARDLRIKIENNLAGHGVHPNAVALFQLPASLGGYLDTARVIVVETIDNMRLAGEDILNAEARLAQGDAEYQRGNYKRAYQRYSEAYAAAAKPIGANDSPDESPLISKSDAADIVAMLQYIFNFGEKIELPATADLDGSGYISIMDLTALIAKVRAEMQNNLDNANTAPDSIEVKDANSNER